MLLATPLIFPLEAGYGITNNILIHASRIATLGLVSESLLGAGATYYMNESLYVKGVYGQSYSGLDESSNDKGLGYSLALGFATSKRFSLEATYVHLGFDSAVSDDKHSDNVHAPYDMLSIAFVYRLF